MARTSWFVSPISLRFCVSAPLRQLLFAGSFSVFGFRDSDFFRISDFGFLPCAMLAALVHFSLRFRGVVIALACLVIGYGLYVAARAKLDVFPEFAPPQVVIQTEAPGMSPEEVEQLVTRPLENALNGAPNLEAIRSQSIQGLAIITVVFKDKTDLLRARQLVSERLFEAVGQLPAGVKPPKMGPLIASTCSVLSIGLTSTNRSFMELRPKWMCSAARCSKSKFSRTSKS
jgi:Cu/Ag efflux pump CusA